MDDHQLDVGEVIDAKKATIDGEAGMALAKEATTVHAAKGKKIVSFKLKSGKLQDDATEEDLHKAIIGPSGKLRAPTIWLGKKTMLVGFSDELYGKIG